MRGTINDMVHFSIDDVSRCFQWINKNRPSSVFDEYMLARLRKWHNLYGLVVDCYVFEEFDGFSIQDLEDNYWKELGENASWLRLGWHQLGPDIDSYDIGDQIASAQRVSKLIVGKSSPCGLSKTLRLHMFAGDRKLIETLKGLGIQTLLTADRNGMISYDLTGEETDLLWKTGNYYSKERNLLYKLTDLRMDLLNSECTVRDIMDRAYVILNRCPFRRRLEVFCHEWKFLKVSEGIEQFLVMIGNVKKKIYLNAATVKENNILFTDIYSSALYEFDTNTYAINLIAQLPIASDGIKYASLNFYKNKLWMVPWETGKLAVYDFNTKKLTEIIISNSTRFSRINFKYRKAVMFKKYLWLLPSNSEILIRIDMDKYQAEIIDGFPNGVTFDKSKDMPFKCMDIFDGELYLFSDSCSHNLKVKADTGEITIWNSDFNGTFGIMLENNKVLLSPVMETDSLRIYHTDTRSFEIIPVPEWIWRKTEIYAFWYACRTEDYIYIMPHEANGIIRYSLQHGVFDFINPPDINYYTLRKNPGFSGYESLETQNNTWLVPYCGNQILCMGKYSSVLTVYDLEVNLAQFHSMVWRGTNIVYESPYANLNDLLEEAISTTYEKYVMDRKINESRRDGMVIYQYIMELEDYLNK